MRSKKGIPWTIFSVFLRSGSKGVPGWSQGPFQGPSRVKMLQKWGSKRLENHQKCYLRASWQRFSKAHALSMLPAGFLKTLLKGTRIKHVCKWLCAFLVRSYKCSWRRCATFVRVKSEHSSTWPLFCHSHALLTISCVAQGGLHSRPKMSYIISNVTKIHALGLCLHSSAFF